MNFHVHEAKQAEVRNGMELVLIAIGVKILIEHLSGS